MRKQVRSSRYSSSYLAELLVDFFFIPAQWRRDSGDDDDDDGGGGGNGTMISPDTGVLHFLLTPLGTSMFEFKKRPTPAPIKLVVLLFMPEQDHCARKRPWNTITTAGVTSKKKHTFSLEKSIAWNRSKSGWSKILMAAYRRTHH